MRYLYLLLPLLAVVLFAGCSLIPQKQYVHPADSEQAIEWPDGSVTQPGEKVYVDSEDRGTAHEVDPETGEPNDPLMVDDAEKVASYVEQGKKLTDQAPPPFSWIAKLILAAAGGGAAVFLGQRLKEKLKSAGAKPIDIAPAEPKPEE